MTALVGRDDTLALAADAVAAARGGEGRVLLVLGEAGIGKTALLGEIAARAGAAGMLVLSGRAAEHERELPFGLATDALDDHAATIHPRRLESLGATREAELAAVLPSVAQHVAPAVASPAERFRYHHSLRALLELLAREKPVALLLDDVHWADDASIELLLHLLRRPPRAPHLLVIAARRIEPAPRLLDALRAARAGETVFLGPLDAEASEALLASVPDPARRERLAQEANGNPLFLTELARVAGDPDAPLPPTLLAAVGQELAALPPDARTLLDGAAVAGDPFDPELAAQAARRDDDGLAGLDALVAADLIRPEGASRRFRFRHPLLRRATYDTAPPAWRLAAHERAARALGARGAPAAARAFHLAQAAKPGDDEAVGVLVEAAGAAMATSPATAAHWYRAALALLPADARGRRAELLGPLGLALGFAGRLEEARGALEEVLALVPAGDPGRPLLASLRAMLDNLMGRHAAARRELEAALAEAPDGPARLPLETALATTATFSFDGATMRRHAERALALAGDDEALAGARILADALAGIGALWEADPDAAAAHTDRALAAFDAAADEALLAWPNAPWALGYGLLLLDRLAEGLPVASRGLDVITRAHAGHMLAPLALLRAMMATNALELGDATHWVDVGEETARLGGMGYQLQWALWLRAGLATVRGDRVESRRLDAESRPLVEALPHDDLIRPTGLCNLAAQRADDDPERCIEEMVAAAGFELEGLDVTWSSWLRLVLVRAGLALGRREDAERWARATEDVAARHGLPIGAARGVTARAELALDAGDADGAVALLPPAIAEFEAYGFRIDALPARILLGRALAAAGDAEAARAVLDAVVAESEERGAWRFRDAAAAELRRLGVRLRPGMGPRGEREELTQREHEIAALVVDGRSNKQVAAALFLSEKTVEAHLSRAYAKLGVKTRRELAAAWQR
jgi:ATP/maltotriose-dependent transcriptional regulator MalT